MTATLAPAKITTRPLAMTPTRHPSITDAALSTADYNRALARWARDPRALMGM